jgi:hypothetical protein
MNNSTTFAPLTFGTNFRPGPPAGGRPAWGTYDGGATGTARRPVHAGRAVTASAHKVRINKEVSVTSMYFQNGKRLQGYPKRIELDGHEYTFLESGLRYLIKKGQQFIQIFDMTDGTYKYRLKFDEDEHTWTLVGRFDLPRALA